MNHRNELIAALSGEDIAFVTLNWRALALTHTRSLPMPAAALGEPIVGATPTNAQSKIRDFADYANL